MSGQCRETTSLVASSSSKLGEARAELLLDGGIAAPPAAVGDLHAEGARAARRGRADLTEADDAERLALQPGSEHEMHVPAPADLAADHALALAEPPRDHQDQGHRDVGGRVREHARRVRDDHAARRAGGHVDVVVAHRHVRDDAQLRPGGREEGLVDAIVQERHHGVCARDRGVQLLDRQSGLLLMRLELARLAQDLEGRLGHAARDDDAPGHQAADCASRSPIFARASSMFSSEFA